MTTEETKTWALIGVAGAAFLLLIIILIVLCWRFCCRDRNRPAKCKGCCDGCCKGCGVPCDGCCTGGCTGCCTGGLACLGGGCCSCCKKKDKRKTITKRRTVITNGAVPNKNTHHNATTIVVQPGKSQQSTSETTTTTNHVTINEKAMAAKESRHVYINDHTEEDYSSGQNKVVIVERTKTLPSKQVSVKKYKNIDPATNTIIREKVKTRTTGLSHGDEKPESPVLLLHDQHKASPRPHVYASHHQTHIHRNQTHMHGYATHGHATRRVSHGGYTHRPQHGYSHHMTGHAHHSYPRRHHTRHVDNYVSESPPQAHDSSRPCDCRDCEPPCDCADCEQCDCADCVSYPDTVSDQGKHRRSSQPLYERRNFTYYEKEMQIVPKHKPLDTKGKPMWMPHANEVRNTLKNTSTK